MGIATMVNRGTSFVVAYTFLTTCERLNWSGSFYLYAAFAALSFVFYALFVPETTNMALEDIAPQLGQSRPRSTTAVQPRARTARPGFRLPICS